MDTDNKVESKEEDKKQPKKRNLICEIYDGGIMDVEENDVQKEN